MTVIYVLVLFFSIVTVLSILLMGSRDIVGGAITFSRLFEIIFHWKFILGAFFAFLARLFFVVINNKVYNMPKLSDSSTTITALVTSIAMIFVVIANYYFLSERLSLSQGIGALLIIIGAAIIMVK